MRDGRDQCTGEDKVARTSDWPGSRAENARLPAEAPNGPEGRADSWVWARAATPPPITGMGNGPDLRHEDCRTGRPVMRQGWPTGMLGWRGMRCSWLMCARLRLSEASENGGWTPDEPRVSNGGSVLEHASPAFSSWLGVPESAGEAAFLTLVAAAFVAGPVDRRHVGATIEGQVLRA